MIRPAGARRPYTDKATTFVNFDNNTTLVLRLPCYKDNYLLDGGGIDCIYRLIKRNRNATAAANILLEGSPNHADRHKRIRTTWLLRQLG